MLIILSSCRNNNLDYRRDHNRWINFILAKCNITHSDFGTASVNDSTTTWFTEEPNEFSTTYEPGNCQDGLFIHTFHYFQITLGTTEDVLSNTTVSVSARIRVGKKKLKCDFFLVFVLETVDVASSSMSCNRGAGGQTARVW